MLYSLFISPIETIVGWVFCFISSRFSSFGIIGAVCGVSLVINFLALPIYNVADAIQDNERKVAKKLEPRVKQIKKAFKGDEQFMILSTYYRQNDYHPLYVLRGSVSILIQIPFFMAAYNYLSTNEALRGSSFWIFRDLGAPDGLLHIGSFPIHVLPILMTLINFVSGAIYTRGFGLKDKIQVYGLAVVFLALLYKSPSGLVIYWILNNIFSLCKNVVKKMKNPGKVLHIIITVIVFGASLYMLRGRLTAKKFAFVGVAVIIALLPLISKLLSKISFLTFPADSSLDFKTVLLSGLGLALLCGLVIPSSVIATSPTEFAFLGNTPNPLTYVWTSLFIFLGLFVLWPGVIGKMFGGNMMKWEGLIMMLFLVLALINTYILKANYGNLNVMFEIGDLRVLINNKKQILISIVIALAVIALLLLVRNTKVAKYIPLCIVAICLAEAALGITKTNTIRTAYNSIKDREEVPEQKLTTIDKEYNLSKTGKNVVVIFLDKAISSFAPEIFDANPSIEKQFDGFVYYPNTVSFSNYTCQGSPGLFGGYEYSTEAINARSDELLSDKHNEAMLVPLKLFSDAGFETTISDPPWPDYKRIGGLSVFDEYPEIKATSIKGKYLLNYQVEKNLTADNIDVSCQTGAVDFAILQIIPPLLRTTFYKSARRSDVSASASSFLPPFTNLYYLPETTDFTAEGNTYTLIINATTHEPDVNLNDDYETIASKQTYDVTLKHYQVNTASYKQIGKWLDYLRANDVYDNTRIIIVADHGKGIDLPEVSENAAWFNPLLLFKDFDSNAPVSTDESFMTNADTLFLSKEGLPVSDINPFTGKKLVQDKDNGVNCYYCLKWNAPEQLVDSYQFGIDMKQAYHFVPGDVRDDSNWIPLKEYEATKEGK